MSSRGAWFAIVLAAGCAIDAPPPDHHDRADGPVGVVESALSDGDPVSEAVAQSCTTSSVKGLSTQLIAEAQCLRPGTFASIEGAPGLTLGGAVFPWLQTPAKEALLAAQKQRGVKMEINSGLRALPQQYLLYRWYKTGRCDIKLAASPGTSNHESALAVDIEDNAGWRSAMSAHDFTWLGGGDPVHFDYTGKGRADTGGLSVLAFQRLWNRNHPEDRIGEDSEYGTATAERLAKAPVGGFPKGADCTTAMPEASPGSEAPSSSAPLPATSFTPGTGTRRDSDDGEGCGVAHRSRRGSTALGLAAGLAMIVVARRRRQGRAR